MSTSNRWSRGDIIARGLMVFIATILCNFMLVVYFHLDQHVPFWILCVMTLIWGLMATYIVIIGRRWDDISIQHRSDQHSEQHSKSDNVPYPDKEEECSGFDGWMSPEDRPTFNPPLTDDEDEDEDEKEDDGWEAVT